MKMQDTDKKYYPTHYYGKLRHTGISLSSNPAAFTLP
jgi:hypothetical protein